MREGVTVLGGLWIFQGAQLMDEGSKDLRDTRLIGKLCIQ